MTEETKQHIDNMNYEDMLEMWRNAPVGHPMFQGEVGEYYSQVMKRKGEEVGNEEHVRASKNIGWEGR